MPPSTLNLPGDSLEPVTLYREMDHVIFEGESGWLYRVPLEQVTTDEQLLETINHLDRYPWMTDDLRDQLRTEVLWLRQQLPPGK